MSASSNWEPEDEHSTKVFEPDFEPHTEADSGVCHTPSDISTDTLTINYANEAIIMGRFDAEYEAGFYRDLASSALLRVYVRIFGFAALLEPGFDEY